MEDSDHSPEAARASSSKRSSTRATKAKSPGTRPAAAKKKPAAKTPRVAKAPRATKASKAAPQQELPLESAAPEPRPEKPSPAPREVFVPTSAPAPEPAIPSVARVEEPPPAPPVSAAPPAPPPARPAETPAATVPPPASPPAAEAPSAAPVAPAGASSPPSGPAPAGPAPGPGPHGAPEVRDRDYWKRLKREKRKRGKHGAPWPPNAGPAHPPQPPPPNLAPAPTGDLPPPARFADQTALDTLAAELAASPAEPLYLDTLYGLPLAELAHQARQLGVKVEGSPSRRWLLTETIKAATEAKRPLRDRGWIDLTDRGHGFVVHEAVNYRLYPENAYLPESLIRRYGLKRGHHIEVLLQAPQGNERCPSVVRIERVMDRPPDTIASILPFEELVPYYPLKRILLEAPAVQRDVSMRAVDILTPIGFGQRGLIVAPPRTGKTVLLQNIANSISHNSPQTKLILLLIDERPEEVTDFRRHTKGEVVSSTFDEAPESHVHCAEMVIEKARRLIEVGEHVVILLDSITRLARAYNALASNSGKIMSGGMEATALQRPKRFFGAARNIEGGGSLTIIATALIDTGSRMDEVIFEEFKGTGNMELHLDRGLSDKRIFPAINIDRSGTRKEELIYHPDEMVRIHALRRTMQGIGPLESMDMLIQRLKKTKTNAEFLMSLNR